MLKRFSLLVVFSKKSSGSWTHQKRQNIRSISFFTNCVFPGLAQKRDIRAHFHNQSIFYFSGYPTSHEVFESIFALPSNRSLGIPSEQPCDSAFRMRRARSFSRRVRDLSRRRGGNKQSHAEENSSQSTTATTNRSDNKEAIDRPIIDKPNRFRYLPVETWNEIQQRLLEKPSFTKKDIIEAEECIRWLTFHARQQVKAKDTTGTAVAAAFELYGKIVSELVEHPEYLSYEDHEISTKQIDDGDDDCKLLINWYTGRYPRATHLLNAILDSWRISYVRDHDVPAPSDVFPYLKDRLAVSGVPIDSRGYSLVMTAAVESIGRTPSKNEVLDAWKVPMLCEDVLHTMLQRTQDPDPIGGTRWNTSFLPDTIAFATVLRAWAKSGRADAAEMAEKLFFNYLALYDLRILGPQAAPNRVLHDTLLSALVALPQIDVTQDHPRRLLVRPLSLAEALPLRRRGLERAEELLREMLSSPYPSIKPSSVSYHTVIFAWADYSVQLRQSMQANDPSQKESVVGDDGAIDRAFNLLREMVEVHQAAGDPNVQVDSSYFSKLITSLARYQPDMNAENEKKLLLQYKKAEHIFSYLLKLYENNPVKRLEPDNNTQRAMIIVYAKSRQPHEADSLLRKLEDFASSHQYPNLLPGPGHYRDVIDAWLEFATQKLKDGHKIAAASAAQKAEDVLIMLAKLLINTNSNPYYLKKERRIRLVRELLRKCEATSRMESLTGRLKNLLEGMNDSSKLRDKNSSILPRKRGLAPKLNPAKFQRLHNSLLRAAHQAIKEGSLQKAVSLTEKSEKLLIQMVDNATATNDTSLLPDRFRINRVLKLWRRCFHPARAEQLFHRINALSIQTTFDEIRPDSHMFLSLMKAISSSQGAFVNAIASKVEEVFLEMHHRRSGGEASCAPTRVHYQIRLEAWARSIGSGSSIEKCEGIFRQACADFEEGNVKAKPDLALYIALFRAYVRAGDGIRSSDLFNSMLEKYTKNNEVDIKPTERILNLVLLSWLKAKDQPAAPKKAMEFFHQVERLNTDTPIVPINERTCELMIQILSRKGPNGATYPSKRYFVKMLYDLRKKRLIQEAST